MKVVALLCLISLAFCALRSTEEWKNGRVVYQVLTDRYSRSDGNTTPCPRGLHYYCGGSYKGLEAGLDDIKAMGFNALWISPIVDQVNLDSGDGYHGYWFKSLNELNPAFGTSEDLLSLVRAAHSKDIWIMVDVVMNHAGPIGDDFGQITPFNKREHYHSDCDINDWNNQPQVENCRLAGLPDLDQSNPWVRKQLLDWITDVIDTYDIDGLRIDTIPEVPTDFWDDFSETIGERYAVGEAYNGREWYVASYTHHLPAVLSYPLYFSMMDVFARGQSMLGIQSTLRNYKKNVRDVDALGTFIENHDQPRFLSVNGDVKSFASALAYTITAEGVPIVYYGADKGFNGSNDPYNREPYWQWGSKNDYLTRVITAAAKLRSSNPGGWSSAPMDVKQVDDHFLAFRKGGVFVTLTNVGSSGNIQRQLRQNQHGFVPGTRLCNVVWGDGDCEVVDSSGYLTIDLNGGEPKIWVQK